MDLQEMGELFERFSETDYIKFDLVENKRGTRPDLHAFLLLDQLVPGTSDIVSGAEHDEFFIGIDVEKLAAVVTEEQVRELVRCGVMYSDDDLCLSMFA